MTVDAENQHLRDRIRLLEDRAAQLQTAASSEDIRRMRAVHHRADAIAIGFGERVAPPGPFDSLDGYTRQAVRGLMKHSPQFADTRLEACRGPALQMIAEEVLANADAAFQAAANAQPGRLVARQERDPAGRLITTFYGDAAVAWEPFTLAGSVGRIERSAVDAGRVSVNPRVNHANS